MQRKFFTFACVTVACATGLIFILCLLSMHTDDAVNRWDALIRMEKQVQTEGVAGPEIEARRQNTIKLIHLAVKQSKYAVFIVLACAICTCLCAAASWLHGADAFMKPIKIDTKK